MSSIEFALISLLSLAYLFVYINHYEFMIILLGFILGGWLISRPSEWLYKGVNALRIHMGLREYLMGILSAFAAVAPEFFFVYLSVWYGYVMGITELIEIAILSTLFTMSLNLFILGTIAIRVDALPVGLTREDMVREMGIVNWTMMASFLLAFLALTKYITDGGSGASPTIPQFGALMLPISYAIYIYALGRKYSKKREEVREGTNLSFLQALFVVIMGAGGTLLGSEVLVEATMLSLSEGRAFIERLGDPVVIVSLVIAVAGAIHDFVLNFFFTVKKQFSATVGNLVGTTLQLLLLIIGLVGVFVPLPLTNYITFELLVISISLWFIRISISDGKVDDYDGALLITLQILALALTIWGF